MLTSGALMAPSKPESFDLPESCVDPSVVDVSAPLSVLLFPGELD
jgi:hypothetical protein